MMNTDLCQSCGMPLADEELFGREKNGDRNKEYCKHCYDEGGFINPDESLKEMIESCVPFMVKDGMTEAQAEETLTNLLPRLKRWNARD